MLSHTIAIIANGPIEDDAYIAKHLKEYDMVVAADGGLNHCHRMGLTPDLIVGDGDSIDPHVAEHYSGVVFRRFPSDKNESDVELAIQAVFTPDVGKITLFGALGGRLDHTLSNLQLLRRYPQKVHVETESESVFAFAGSLEMECHPGQTVSFMALGDPVAGVFSEGLKWELRDASFSKYFFSLSNECVKNKFKVTIGQGDLICCLQKS